jgi:hypothetical protein
VIIDKNEAENAFNLKGCQELFKDDMNHRLSPECCKKMAGHQETGRTIDE